MYSTQKGNVLFLILIAVALFAALSYAVTSSTRSGENGIGSESLSTEVSALLQTMHNYSTTINRMIMFGCTPNEISFAGGTNFQGAQTGIGFTYVNPNSPTDYSCHVFSANGGGLTYYDPDQELIDFSLPQVSTQMRGHFVFVSDQGLVTTDGLAEGLGSGGIADIDTVMVQVPYVTDAVCLEINERLFGIDSIPTNGTDDLNSNSGFAGTLDASGAAAYIPCETSDITYNGVNNIYCGDYAGCYRPRQYWSQSNVNIAYQVIIVP